MPQPNATINYTSDPFIPLYDKNRMAQILPVNLPPSVTLTGGTVLGLIASSANDVQTITCTSLTTGTWTITGTNPLTGLAFTVTPAWNITTANLQALLVASTAYGAGNVVVTGTTSTSYVLTFGGSLANMPIPLVTINATGASGSTIAPAHTTVGTTAGTYGAYSSAVLAPPAAAPTLTPASGTSPGAGTWSVAYTALNAQGETTISPIATATVTSGQKFTISSTALPSGATGLNWYVSAGVGGPLVFYSTQASAAAQDVTAAPTATNVLIPRTNTAYTAVNGVGTQTPKAVLQYSCSTDASGNVSFTATAGGGGGFWGETFESAPAYFSGVFDTSKMTGLDAAAVTALGRLWYGTTSVGCLRVF